ncbi:unnamed protein product [Moneuplotes crassus]|uniref:Uncharacterized protein n=1 Tax=Euplotes crassus TaxID=5936 RepID=A0AAD2CZM7_EUPCR|nr:unnamed protein product [Moneuplotes crassus]
MTDAVGSKAIDLTEVCISHCRPSHLALLIKLCEEILDCISNVSAAMPFDILKDHI